MESVLKKNDEITLEIERFGDLGEGIGKVDGKVIFVPFSLPGETIKAHIIFDKKNYLVGKCVEVINASEDRVTPPCPYFYKCGGCDLQHISAEKQREIKHNMVIDNLKKFGKIYASVNDVIVGEKKLRYRNKFAFPVKRIDGKVEVGMYRKNSHDIIPISDCLLQEEFVKVIISDFKQYAEENNVSIFDEEKKTGMIKHLVVRGSEDGFILTVVTADENIDLKGLVSKLKTHFNNFGVVKNVNKLNNNVIFGEKDINVYGISELSLSKFGVNFYVNNRSFLQVNDEIMTKIYQKVIELTHGEQLVIDAYSGAGLLSAIIAKSATKVIGVEIVKEATKNAELLKKINNLTNLTNINGDCAQVIPEITKNLDGNFVVVVDPPRKGLDSKVIDALNKTLPKKIIYISCNPSSLSRDLSYFTAFYEVSFIEPYDMFPQTANVETLVLLSKKNL